MHNHLIYVSVSKSNHMCILTNKHVEYNDPAPSPKFEYPVFGTEEEEYDEIP